MDTTPTTINTATNQDGTGRAMTVRKEGRYQIPHAVLKNVFLSLTDAAYILDKNRTRERERSREEDEWRE